ncbi:MAG: general secretion pathway protein GspF [Candidatus Babeliales bacterium]
MALFSYQAFSKDGKKITGTVDAPSLQAAKEQLSKQGIYPISVTPSSLEAAVPWYKRIFQKKITIKDKILFTKQLAVLLKSGVPLLQALELLIEQFEGNLRSVLVQIKDEVKEGTSFADALKRYPKVFDNIYVQLVRAGEASGKLETILERLTAFMERRAEIRKRVRSALTGPIIQLIMAVLVVSAMMIFVVPTMAENFAESGKELPTPTAILLGISNIFTRYYLVVIILLIIAIIAYRYWRSTPAGARTIDQIKLKLPIIGYFTRTNAIVQFCYTLGMLLEGGVNLAESLDIVVNIIDNRVLADALREARDKIIKQGKIAQYLKQTGIFPPIATYLISTGEQTGQLDKMLLTVAQNYEQELSEYADSLSARIGPILLIVMALIVGFIVIALMLPMTRMGDTLEGI